MSLATGSKGEAHAQALPASTTGVSASCAAPTTSQTIKVSWTTVTHATTYTVYQSTTSASTGYAVASGGSGITTTSWTSGTLTAAKNYWFEVVANIGSNWFSANSTATAETTINSSNPFCQQP